MTMSKTIDLETPYPKTKIKEEIYS